MILRPEIRDLIDALQREIEVLREENAASRQEVADLRRQLDKNSSNSSKPPLSDGVKKPPRIAGKSARQVGQDERRANDRNGVFSWGGNVASISKSRLRRSVETFRTAGWRRGQADRTQASPRGAAPRPAA